MTNFRPGASRRFTRGHRTDSGDFAARHGQTSAVDAALHPLFTQPGPIPNVAGTRSVRQLSGDKLPPPSCRVADRPSWAEDWSSAQEAGGSSKAASGCEFSRQTAIGASCNRLNRCWAHSPGRGSLAMTPDDFRRLALSQPEGVEVYRGGHSEFRVLRRSFASLEGPADSVATVQLTSEQQAMFMQAALGGWGRLGATNVVLMYAKEAIVESALAVASQHRPKVTREIDRRAENLLNATVTARGYASASVDQYSVADE
jgi:hypothetical protein